MDFSFIFKDDVVVSKDGDKEAPIDSETVNNPMEPIRIEERIKKKKKKKEKKMRPPTKLLVPPSPGHRCRIFSCPEQCWQSISIGLVVRLSVGLSVLQVCEIGI